MEFNKEAYERLFYEYLKIGRIGKSTHRLSASEVRKLVKESTKSYGTNKLVEKPRLKILTRKK